MWQVKNLLKKSLVPEYIFSSKDDEAEDAKTVFSACTTAGVPSREKILEGLGVCVNWHENLEKALLE